MSKGLTVKVATRRMWMFRLACKAAIIGHRLGLPDSALSRLLTWGVRRIQLRVGNGRWAGMAGSVTVGL